MIRLNLSKIFGFLFILVSLQTHYFYQISAPAISLMGLLLISIVLIILFFYEDLKLSISNLSVFLFLIILFIYSAISFLINDPGTELSRVLGFIIVIYAAFLAALLINIVHLKTLIKTFLLVHIFCFYLQFFVFYLFGYHIDFIEPITGESQRVIGGTFQFFVGSFIRPSGLFSEPGTYALFIAPVLSIYTRYSMIDPGENTFWYLCILSLFLSFSLYGIIFAMMIFGLRISSKVKLSQIMILVSILVIVSGYIQYRLVASENSLLPEGSSFRIEFIQKAYEYFIYSGENFLFGANLFSKLPGFEFSYAINDVGLVIYLFHFSGLIGTLIIFAFFSYWFFSSDKFSRLSLLIILLSKFSIFYPFFPLILSAALKNENILTIKSVKNIHEKSNPYHK